MPDEGGAVELSSGASHARIAMRGAELRAWRCDDRDLLWRPEAPVWPATSPILFPIVGRLRGDQLLVDGRRRPMGVHGFAASSMFALQDRTERAARLVLRDTPASRDIYPFRFELTVAYEMNERALSVSIEATNVGDAPLPYACGLHPGFRWPFDGGEPGSYRVLFEAAEAPTIPEITADGLFGPGVRRSPLNAQRTVELSHELLSREALCFLHARSRVFRFIAPTGREIRVEADGFPHFALWSKPPAPFLCLESWTGHGDPAGFTGDVFEKPSMLTLAPGASARHGCAYALV